MKLAHDIHSGSASMGLMTEPQWHPSDLDQLHQGTQGTAAKSLIEATPLCHEWQGFPNPAFCIA